MASRPSKREREEDVLIVDDADDVVVLPASPAAQGAGASAWPCASCTLRNHALALACAACGQASPHAPAPAPAPAQAPAAAGGPPLVFAQEPLTRLQGVTARLGAALAAPQGQARGVQARLLASALCCGAVDFFSQAEVGAGWACGWRCQQMVLSQLLAAPALRARLLDGSGRAPSIGCLQGALERAWAMGYDPTGCAQLGGRVRNTTAFIGAGEAAALLRSLGVPAQWHSFHSFDDPNLEALLGGGVNPGLLARVQASRRAAEAVRACQDPAQPTLHAALGLAPPAAAAARPAWHSCRAHDFDACAACHEACRGGGGSSSSSSSSGAGSGAGSGLLCRLGCRLTPSTSATPSHMQRTCDLCGGRGGEGGRGSSSSGRLPADTPQERHYLHTRHSALLRWIGRHWGGPLARGAVGGAGSSSSSSSSSSSNSSGSASVPYCCYLQHDGHSRVLVGYELTEGAGGGLRGGGSSVAGAALAAAPHLPRPSEHLALYLLDPGVPEGDLDRGLRSGHAWAPLVKRGLHTLRKAHYEVVWVPSIEEWGRYAAVLDPRLPHTPTRFFE